MEMNKIKNQKKIKSISRISLIAALYGVFTLSFANLSFGIFQFRISEILTILPVFIQDAITGLTVGCIISNIYGASTGLTCIWDIIIGSVSTLISAILTYKFRNISYKGLPILSTIPPIVINAVIISTMLTFRECGTEMVFNIWLKNALSIAIGQFVTCFIGGLLLAALLKKTICKQPEEAENFK